MTSRFVALGLAVFLAAAAAQAQFAVLPPPVIGSGNTATADPGVARPEVTPCIVQLFTDLPFADFSPKAFAYAPPPACRGPWQKVVLEAEYSVDAGWQVNDFASPIFTIRLKSLKALKHFLPAS